MSGVRFYPSGGTSLAPGVVLPSFTANTIPYINGSQEVAEDVNFTYQSGQLGIGISSSLGATVHIKGANDSTGASLIAQSATYEILKAYNSRNLNIGGGTVSAGTDYKITAFGTATADTHLTLQIIGYNNDNKFNFGNTNGYTRGGLEIYRDQNSYGRNALSIFGGGVNNLYITSNGTIVMNRNTWSDDGIDYIQATNTSGKEGLWFNSSNGIGGFTFHQGRSLVPFNARPFMRLYTDYVDSGLPNTIDQTIFTINPSVNMTGTGVKNIIGFDYNPSISSLTGGGKHYGLLIKSGLNGFGLGGTMPTATITITPSTTANAPLNIAAGTAPSSPNNGDIWTEGTDLKIRLGGTTYTVTKV